MCSIEICANDDADDNPPPTARDSAFGVPDFCGLLSKLKCTSVRVAGLRYKRRQYLRKYAQTERGKETIRRYTERNRPKRNAYNAMRRALKNGDLTKAIRCEVCNIPGVKLDGHHDDYAKPLEVRWLCRDCHKTWHRKNGKALNG